MEKKYIISKVSVYDSDEKLWFTKVGEDKKEMPLLYICAGKTRPESRKNAENLVELLSLKVQNG